MSLAPHAAPALPQPGPPGNFLAGLAHLEISNMLKTLKTFVDVNGRRVGKGLDVPADAYDKDTMAHYQRHGMVGQPAAHPAAQPARAPRSPRTPRPTETKPAAPNQPGAVDKTELPPQDPDRKGGENNPMTDADAAADLAGQPRPQ